MEFIAGIACPLPCCSLLLGANAFDYALQSLVGSRVFPKLPPRLFEDVSEDGALHAIATKLYSIRKSRDLKAFEWMNPGKRKEVSTLKQRALGTSTAAVYS